MEDTEFRFKRGTMFFHLEKKTFLEVYDYYNIKDGGVGYTLKPRGSNPYITRNDITTNYVRYNHNRLLDECKKMDETAMAKILYGHK